MSRLTIYIFLFLIITGCSKITDEKIPLSQAEEKFRKICLEEYQLNVVTKTVGRTFWIYLPLEDPLIDFKASEKGPSQSKESSEKIAIKYIDVRFENGRFIVEYDIGPSKTYAKDPGYTSTYPDAYQKKQTNVVSAIQRAFLDADQPPVFVVFSAADINHGIELESILYLDDLKRAVSFPPAITQEEYTKRYVSELRGDPKVTGDKDGKHLSYRDIAMGEFLAKQINNRVGFKYQRSSFPPSADTEVEIRTIINETLQAYDFKDYSGVDLVSLQ